VQVGNLVKITRASIGVPRDSMGMIIKVTEPRGDYVDQYGEEMYPPIIFIVQLVCNQGQSSIPRRYLPRDLEVVSG